MKTITRILTLVLVLAMFACTATTAFAASDDGNITVDTVIFEYGDKSSNSYHGKKTVTVGDLFTSGTIGSAESSGSLALNDSVTWTLKNGVCILYAHPEKAVGSPQVHPNIRNGCPLWNNSNIQTVVIDARIFDADTLTFHFGLPNLNTVIVLGPTGVTFGGGVSIHGKTTPGTFPNDHTINYLFEQSIHDIYGRVVYSDYKPVISTSYNMSDWATGAAKFYDSRAAYVADAAPILASAVLNADAVAMLPSDIVSAVNAIGGFASLGSNPASASETTPTVGGFSDVHEGDYYAEAVLWAVNHDPQITNGIGGGQFGSTSTVTRSQAVTFLWRAANCPEPTSTSSPFSDVPDPEAWYYKAVLWAAEQGITNGNSATTFGVNDTLAYDQMLTFMARAAGADTSGDWSGKAITWAAENGLTDGLTFSAKASCPRADVVYCLWKQMA